ncbi:hypothetical protein FNU76_13030 [Chitinimonas arctica]|uniref:Uncharacterized protein n=1 Tax=Chitinimonas arctica TaxID=2594795 RepID=A0A516SGI2_9NEIS|nr:hypothetical protein [Chitinimonas arctica]QDQ27210.1 hypothetical protein FNU76_13030 [Chitinimonas arctica]
MTKLRYLLAASLLAASALAQAAPSPQEPLQLTMRFQQAAPPAPGDIQLHFAGYHDTRCPSDVNCAVAGEAVALFWVYGPHIKPQVIALPWDGGSEQLDRHAKVVGKYRVYLSSLEPRPRQAGQVNPSEYTAVVKLFGPPALKSGTRK